jgi:hypothetical protein
MMVNFFEHTVADGFCQITGQALQEKHEPVVNFVSALKISTWL